MPAQDLPVPAVDALTLLSPREWSVGALCTLTHPCAVPKHQEVVRMFIPQKCRVKTRLLWFQTPGLWLSQVPQAELEATAGSSTHCSAAPG